MPADPDFTPDSQPSISLRESLSRRQLGVPGALPFPPRQPCIRVRVCICRTAHHKKPLLLRLTATKIPEEASTLDLFEQATDQPSAVSRRALPCARQSKLSLQLDLASFSRGLDPSYLSHPRPCPATTSARICRGRPSELPCPHPACQLIHAYPIGWVPGHPIPLGQPYRQNRRLPTRMPNYTQATNGP